MKELLFKIWDRLLLYIFVLALSIWLFGQYVTFESRREAELLQSEIDLVSYRLNTKLAMEGDLLIEKAKKLSEISGSENEDTLRQILAESFGNEYYTYSLHIKPDKIINGTDQVSPYDLEATGFKRYGDKFYYSMPYMDEEGKQLLMTIYLPLEMKEGQKALLYRSVDIGPLMRSLIRLNSQYGGIGLLLNDDRQVINFSSAIKVSSESISKIQKLLGNRVEIGQMTQRKSEKVLIIRVLGTSNWYFAYYQDQMKTIEAIKGRGIVLLLSYFVLLIFIVREGLKSLRLERRMNEIDMQEDSNGEHYGQILDCLKYQTSQIERIKDTPYSGPLVEYLTTLNMHIIAERSVTDYLMPSVLFTKWALAYRKEERKVNIEESSETSKWLITPSILNLGIDLILTLAELDGEGGMQIKCDSENRLVIFSFYGNLIKKIPSLMETLTHRQGFINSGDLPMVNLTTLANKIILAENDGYSLMPKVYMASEKSHPLPIEVYFLETSDEKNIVLKFYLEHLGISYKAYYEWQDTLDNKVIFVSDKFLRQIIWSENETLTKQNCVIVFGDQAIEVNDRWHNINRPYSLEKIVYALQAYPSH